MSSEFCLGGLANRGNSGDIVAPIPFSLQDETTEQQKDRMYVYMPEHEKMEAAIVNKTVTGILMSEQFLSFETPTGTVTFGVTADCCSRSYFFDFYGVERILGSKIARLERVELSPGDVGYHESTYTVPVVEPGNEGRYSRTKVYGYRLITEHPLFGEVSSVFSFRNDSNGYYGGEMYLVDAADGVTGQELLLKDKIG